MEKDIIYAHLFDKTKLNINRTEILRYMGCKEETLDVKALVDEYVPKVIKSIDAKGCFGYFDINTKNDSISIKDLTVESQSLAKNLDGATGAAVFCVTLGAGLDRLISKALSLSPAAGVCIDAISAAAIEGYADILSNEILDILHKDGLYPRPRFSPGYGDFDINYQKDILNLTNAQKLCGVHLSQSLMMIPSKSITAVIGFAKSKMQRTQKGCIFCEKKDCQYRREGKNYENNR